MSEDPQRRAEAAEKTVEVLKRKVLELYNGERSAIQRQLDAARRREEDNRRKRELAEVRAGELARYNQTLEAEVARRTEAIKTILDNVTFGFLVVGRDLLVQPETTRSCVGLFGTSQVEGRPLAELLGLPPRRREEFALAADQVFEDILPPEVSLGQMQQKFPMPDGRILRAEGSVIRGQDHGVRAMLFTLSDITALEEATRESNNNRTLVGILKQREAFLAFLVETQHQLKAARLALGRGDHALVARVVHTIKGNSASYGLTDLVEQIHAIEEAGAPTGVDLDTIERGLRAFLDRNRGILEIDYDRVDAHSFEVTGEQIAQLRGIAAGVQGAASEQLRRWSARVLSRPASQLLGPVDDFTARLAERLGKEIDFHLSGADTVVDVEAMRPVLMSVTHLIRNAVDHGIEPPGDRSGKPPRGQVRVEVDDVAGSYLLSVHDDGRGIDLPTLRRRALEQKLLTPEQIEALPDPLALIFIDGLSSAAVTTHISGRGIGMSAVKAAVDAAAGTLRIETAPGQGTSFHITIPKPEADPQEPPP
jgi:two-component system chemotaxis sensor kinase CheA